MLHRFSVLVACSTLLLVVAGALVTSNDAGLSVPDWPLSYGQLMPKMEGGIFWEHGHRMVATTVGFLTLILAVWIARVETRPWLRILGWSALGAVVAQGLLGGITVLLLQPKPVSIGHACLAELFFSTTVAIAWFTSPAWRRGGPNVEDPGLHRLALAAPVSVFIQLALGAAARHKALGALAHIAWAPVTTGMVLWLVTRILMRHSGHGQLRTPALALVTITFAQVFLGIAAYMSRIATVDAPQPMKVMVVFTSAHVALGAMTLACSILTGIQVFRYAGRVSACPTIPEALPANS
ncbi:MAG: COX15/CtaA family protein [Acidobacteria bacterium]|nr:COX15/CtaA family protein [Acidobacteriota bacterium]